MKPAILSLPLSLLLTLAQAMFAPAATVPFVEDFADDHANWLNFNSSAFLTFQPAGGPDGSSYVAGSFNFVNSVFGDQGPVLLRAGATPLGSASGGNLFGDWIADGVAEFTAWVRHDAPTPLTYFVRFADSVNFPGGTAIEFTPVLPNTWTQLNFSIGPASTNFVTFEGTSFGEVFDNIGRIQIGVSIPETLAGVNQPVTFDLDQVAINVPEPATLLLGCLAAATVLPVCIRTRLP